MQPTFSTNNAMNDVALTDFGTLLNQFELFLFDAYGVLVSGEGPLPNAKTTLDAIRASGKDFKIVTNDASRNSSQQFNHYSSFDFPVTPDNIISSGSLVTSYFQEHNLAGAKTLVLGPEPAWEYVTLGGGEIVDFSTDSEPEVIVLLNESFTDNLADSLSVLLSVILKELNKGNAPKLVVANPDLNYPAGPETFNIAPGSIALMLEASINNNFSGEGHIEFTKLGKPYAPIFEKAIGDADRSKVVFFGDQFATDILGANSAGIFSALMLTGVSRAESITHVDELRRPKFVLNSLG